MVNSVLDLTSKLIKIPSVSSDINALNDVVSFIKNYLKDTSLHIKEFTSNSKPSLLISLNPNLNPQIILNGHADVVPAKPNQFEPFVKDDKLYGRGAQDMKSGLAAMISVMVDLAQSKSNLPVALMVVTDEEVGGFDGTKHVLNAQNLKPEFFIAGESTDLAIEYEAKGILWLNIKTKGKNAHGAYPWEGQNAIAKLADEINVIKNLYPTPKEFKWETTANLSKLTAGLAMNQVPDMAQLSVDIRRIPQESDDQVLSNIKSHLNYEDTQIEIIFNEPSHSADPNHLLVQKLSTIIKSHTQKPTQFIQKCGASDARHFSAQGVTSICFGPTGAGLHQDEEYLQIPSLKIYHQILKEFLLTYQS